jgi:hypothetical protein
VFPDGQALVYDNYRLVDWKTRDDEHLIYPEPFGNEIDIGAFQPTGLPHVVPPEGGSDAPQTPSSREHAQSHTAHPWLTTPMTLSLQEYHHDANPRWFEPTVDGNRVTFHWWQPMTAMGYKAWVYLLVWETWWPIQRSLHDCTYRGLARLIEVELPGSLEHGYQVMVNDGFGPGGSRRGVVSYSSGFRRPGHEIVDFSEDENKSVCFQYPKPPRLGKGYHPNQDCLQASPLVFYDWSEGSLLVTARSLYYHCANNSSSYPEQGADGVWPNLAWDMTAAGKRTAVDTVEYLYTSDTEVPLPQRYVDARAYAYSVVSERMGVQDDLAASTVEGTHFSVMRDGGPEAHANKQIERFGAAGINGFFIFHDFWNSVPATVGDDYRLSDEHDSNPKIRAMCNRFHEAGISVGFWYRPEFTKTSLVNVLSETIPTAETYYGYKHAKYPNVVKLLNERGLPLVRENPHWIRLRSDGSWPYGTPYQWTPMRMDGEWWERIMWPTLVMSKRLGFDWVLIDGGFGGMQGVYYNGSDRATPCQPYWWRMFRSLKALGLRQFGECTVGWRGATVNHTGPGDEFFLWMFHQSTIPDKPDLHPEHLHKLYQLYNGFVLPNEAASPVARFAREFFSQHGPPSRLELRELRQLERREVTVAAVESAPAGGPTRVTGDKTITFNVSPWVWSDVVWHYEDEPPATYPAYDSVDWDEWSRP